MTTSDCWSAMTANEDHVALLVIDVQRGLFGKSTPIYEAERLLENINALIEWAHCAEAPVVYVQHNDKKGLLKGSEDWQLHPRLHVSDAYCVVDKHHGNAFEGTILHEALRSKGIRCVVITGLVTHGCVRATCLGAKELGYDVILASDGHSSYNKDAARLIEEWNQKLGEEAVELRPVAEITFG